MAALCVARRPPPAHFHPIVLLRLVDSDRQILEHLEPHLRETEPDGAAAMLALVARASVDLDEGEPTAAIRRALLVQASGETCSESSRSTTAR